MMDTRRLSRNTLRRLGPLLLTVLVGACTEGMTEPSVMDVAGTYVADSSRGQVESRLTGDRVDWLERGGSVHLVLHRDHTTSGTMVLPDPDDVDGPGTGAAWDLAGTWRLEGDSVLLTHDAPTWLRALTFRYVDSRLTGSSTLNTSSGPTELWITIVRY